MSAVMSHRHYETFELPDGMYPLLPYMLPFTFLTDSDGNILSLSAPFEPMVKDAERGCGAELGELRTRWLERGEQRREVLRAAFGRTREVVVVLALTFGHRVGHGLGEALGALGDGSPAGATARAGATGDFDAIGHGDSKAAPAEAKGFEPLVPLRVRRFSKPLPSTTRPRLRRRR